MQTIEFELQHAHKKKKKRKENLMIKTRWSGALGSNVLHLRWTDSEVFYAGNLT